MITNPDALFHSPEAEQQFIIELKEYIKDRVSVRREGIWHGTNDHNRSSETNPENK